MKPDEFPSFESAVPLWAEQTQSALTDLSGQFRSFFQEPGRLDAQTEFVLGQLHLRSTATSDSALLLITEGRLWDAEILIRTVSESTLKFLFICATEGDAQRARAHEFIATLPEIASLRRHRRAQEFLSHVADRGAPEWRPLRDLLLPAVEVVELGVRYPKSHRDQLAGRWGFTAMVEALRHSGLPGYEMLVGMLYPYGMGSHAVHHDGDALLMMWEREQRERQRIDAIELAHAAREMSDLISFAELRTLAAYRTRRLDVAPVLATSKRLEPLLVDFDAAYSCWHDVEYSPEISPRTLASVTRELHAARSTPNPPKDKKH